MRYLRLVTRWPIALACVIVLAAAVLLPGLGDFGLWEPQERGLSDRIAPRTALIKTEAPQATLMGQVAAGVKKECERVAPKDATARTLGSKAMVWGRDHLADSDAGRRLPFALLGFLTVLATAGIALRFASARAGLFTAAVLLAMPLLVFQSRQLTSEIGTAAGASLTVYGLITVAGRGMATFSVLGIVELVIALASLAAGLAIGFASGGALLGVLVPVGGVAAALGLTTPLLRTGLRAVLARTKPAWRDHIEPADAPLRDQIKGAVLSIATCVIAGVLAYQLFSLSEPQPGMFPPQRALFGHAIAPSGCWSDALGGLWRVDDDVRYIFDSTFEQIAYGTFPWGILAPIAMASLLFAPRREHRVIGALSLAWGGAAWIASEAFQRKVAFTLFAGFPALALAVGTWLDAALERRGEGEADSVPRAPLLVGGFLFLGVLVIGKDLQSFAEKLTALLVGSDVPYPTMSRTLWLPTRLWVLILGAYIALACALALATWRPVDPAQAAEPAAPLRPKTAALALVTALFYPIALPIYILNRWTQPRWQKLRVTATSCAFAAISGTLVLAAFWAFVWQPKIATHVSSRAMFDTYLSLRKPGDQLVIMGDLGDAPHDYAPDANPEIVPSRDQIVAAIGRANRVFAITPQTELCQLHREIGGKPYYVIDDRNLKSLLLSNRVDGTTDKNPLARAIVHEEPKNIPHRVPLTKDGKEQIIYDERIALIGWDIPKSVGRGSKFEAKLYYKILQPVGANWTVIMHFDGEYGRAGNGDHKPINDRCPTSTWQPGDYIIDTFTVPGIGGAYPAGQYGIYTGFFTGTAPNYKNMRVSQAPPDMLDAKTDRVKITTISLD